ncbi:MAG: Na/Pi cotransporter family protein [Kiritimatiellae bacterium]|nr:Na/Pi cotransporter family protein [Kiritimatiellia bacterium]MBQ3340831.1 Na/Pi cotransporter family protein [Kiritimatiellia bacterium]MBQ6328263.1 Na/Pi cotransporter family protein [Kiritimatiellia bacterium]
MGELTNIILALCGGLGLFLLGMRHLSEGLQAASGERIRRVIGFTTTNRPAGVVTGAIAAIVVQSSSVVSVMLVGFVSAGLMSLAQAVNVLVGANIGTTATVWLMAFAPSPEMLGLTLAVLGGIAYFPLRRGRLRHVGLATIGLGLVFLGMAFMKQGVAPIRESQELSAALGSLAATSFVSAALVALASAAFTAIIQSSAAAIVIFMTFASEGLVTGETAIAALFGANIGTTATGWLASIGASAGAKRTALANTLMNVLGSVVLLPFVLTVFVPLARLAFPSAFAPTADGLFPRIMLPIAVVDTFFAFMRGALVLPFVRPFSRLVERLVPERKEEKPHLSVLDANVSSPLIACEQALVEISFMAESVVDMLAHVRLALTGKDAAEAERHVCRREDVLDNVQREITVFVGRLMTPRISSATAVLEQRILRLADDFESASDELRNVVKALRRLREAGEAPQGGDLATILDIHDRVETLARFSRAELRGGVSDMAARREASSELKELILAARQVQILRVGVDGGASSSGVLAELDLFNAYNRFRSLCMAIAVP